VHFHTEALQQSHDSSVRTGMKAMIEKILVMIHICYQRND